MSTNLVSGGIETRSLTFIAIGGSGIRALEPLLFLCAFGLGPRKLKVLLIDPDQSNAAVTRVRDLLDKYQATRAALIQHGSAPSGYFRTEISDALASTPVWSPITDLAGQQSGAFQSRIDRAQMSGPTSSLRHLTDLLYSQQQREMDLTMGFRGVPAIGTVFMHRLRREPFFKQLLENAQTDSDMLYFTVGSIFGGTGAAGTPVVGRVLVDGIPGIDGANDVRGVAPRRIGAALLMPYFTLPAPSSSSADDGGIRPQSSLFAQNAAAALSTYSSGEAGYGSYYAIGDDQPRQQSRNEVGGAAQDNLPHYVELFAAFAALDFTARGGESAQESLPKFQATAISGSNIGWSDLPIDQVSRDRLIGAFATVHTFLRLFRPDGKQNPGGARFLKGVTWVNALGLTSSDFEKNSAAFDKLGEFYLSAWNWIGELRASEPAVELVRTTGARPTTIALHETIEGRRPHGSARTTTDAGLEPFRHWNMAAQALRGSGQNGFLELMRTGSESFTSEYFAESTAAH